MPCIGEEADVAQIAGAWEHVTAPLCDAVYLVPCFRDGAGYFLNLLPVCGAGNIQNSFLIIVVI